MPARINLAQTQKTREKIRASQLINRLTDHALGDDELMSASQVNAARVLLNKILPDLKAMEHTGPDGGPMNHNLNHTITVVAAKDGKPVNT